MRVLIKCVLFLILIIRKCNFENALDLGNMTAAVGPAAVTKGHKLGASTTEIRFLPVPEAGRPSPGSEGFRFWRELSPGWQRGPLSARAWPLLGQLVSERSADSPREDGRPFGSAPHPHPRP